MRRLRVLVLMHKDLVPPDPLNEHDPSQAEWRTEYNVVTTLRKMGHDVRALGVKSDLGVIRIADVSGGCERNGEPIELVSVARVSRIQRHQLFDRN